MAKITYPTIADDSLIDIKVSGAFHKRLINLLAGLGETVPLEEFKKVLERIKENKPNESLFEFNVHTILMLVYEVELEAKKQNKITTAEIDDGKPETTSDSSQPNPQS